MSSSVLVNYYAGSAAADMRVLRLFGRAVQLHGLNVVPDPELGVSSRHELARMDLR